MSFATVDHDRTSLLKAYFPGLNELRALAALCVLLSHIEQMKELAGLPYSYWFPIPGKLGVVLFFALSGFLITSILVREKTSPPCRIDLRKFYLKRILRIWPLYFLVVAASLLVINRLSVFEVPDLTALAYNRLDTTNLLLLLFILPNYVEVLIPYLTQIWSIGIEEQFYLVQPCLVKFVRTDKALIILMSLTVFLKEILLLVNRLADSSILHDIANQSVYMGCIAIGCISALLCHEYARTVIRILHSRIIQLATAILFIAALILIGIYKDVTIIDYRYYAILFSVVIVNAATNPGSCYNLNSKSLDYLGTISYGLYMYHEIGIGCSIAAIKYFGDHLQNYLLLNIAIYSVSLAVTLLISVLSFRYFEGFFLRYKDRLPQRSAR